MTASIESDLQELGRQRPEWEPWLAVIQEVLRETANAQWDGFVPSSIEGGKAGPASGGRHDFVGAGLAAPLDGAAVTDRQPERY
jgi:hypothetical protein